MLFRKLAALLIIYIFCSTSMYSQSGILDINTYNNPNEKTIEYYYDESYCPNTNVDDGYRLGSSADIGSDSWNTYDPDNKCNNGHERRYRTVYKIPLSPPTDGILVSVKIRASGTINGDIVEFSEDEYTSAYYDIYDEVGLGSSLLDFNTQLSDWEDITSFASDYLNDGQFCLGAIASGSGYGNVSLNVEITWKHPASISVANSFGSGLVKVDGVNVSSGSSFDGWFGDDFSLEAIDNQLHGGYYYIFNNGEATNSRSEWERIGGIGSYINNSQSITIYLSANDHNSTYRANMKKICNITFANELNGTSATGTMTVGGTSVSAPTSDYTIVEDNSVAVIAVNQYTFDDVKYVFSHWDNNTSDNNRTKTFTASQHYDHEAKYIGTPQSIDLDITFKAYNPRQQEYVTVYWDEHPSSGVTQYQIWRKLHTGEEHIGTVNRGTTTYVDSDYFREANGQGESVGYGIRAMFPVDDTYSAIHYSYVDGEENSASKQSKTDTTEVIMNEILDYSICNYPNPYNPATNIFYQIPENGHVSLKVYDMLGREVTELVNSVKTPGRYEVQFDGSNLSSGTYIYQIIVDALGESIGYSASRKMLLVK